MNAMIQEREHARLPAAYETACDALAACEKIDECKDWAGKAAALASYAKQAMDDTLLAHARRIQMRAVNRMGELLKEVEPHRGVRTDLEHREADRPKSETRKSVAEAAGLSEFQRKTALRVASVPREQFEAMVESERPPTVTALSQWGVEPPKHPAEFQRRRLPTNLRRGATPTARGRRDGLAAGSEH